MTDADKSTMMKRLYWRDDSLYRIDDNDEIFHALEVLSLKKIYKQNGDPALFLTLGDRTRDVPAVAWKNVEKIESFATKGAVLVVQGYFTNNGHYGRRITIDDAELLAPGEYDPERVFISSPTPYRLLVRDLRKLIATIEDEHLRELLQRLLSRGEFAKRWRAMPAAKFYHQPYRYGLMEHSLSVAWAVSTVAEIFPGIHRDLAVSGALLHDMGKVDAYEMLGRVIDFSDAGRLEGEIPLGYYRLRCAIDEIEGFDRGLAKGLRHIILSHHGKLAYGSPVIPRTGEAVLVHMMDNLGGTLGTFDRLEKGLAAGERWSHWDKVLGGCAFFGEIASGDRVDGDGSTDVDEPTEVDGSTDVDEPTDVDGSTDVDEPGTDRGETGGGRPSPPRLRGVPGALPHGPRQRSTPPSEAPPQRDLRRGRVRQETSELIRTRSDINEYLLDMAESYAHQYPHLLEDLPARDIFGTVGALSVGRGKVFFDLRQEGRRLHCAVDRATYDRWGIELGNRMSVVVRAKPSSTQRTKLQMTLSDLDMWSGEDQGSTDEQPRSVDDYALRLARSLAGQVGPEVVAERPLRQIRGVIGPEIDLGSDPARFYLLATPRHGVRCEIDREALSACGLELESGVEVVITATPTSTPDTRLLFEVEDLALEEWLGRGGRPAGTDPQAQRCLRVITEHRDTGITAKDIAVVFLAEELPAEEWARLNREGNEEELKKAILKRRTNIYQHIEKLKGGSNGGGRIEEVRRGTQKLWFPSPTSTEHEQ
jgi:3'-5' exoribonuclease